MTDINTYEGLRSSIFQVDANNFEELALHVFRYQSQHNPIYGAYCKAIGCNPNIVQSLQAIPFLPIQFYKSHEIKSYATKEEMVFESSGTTGSINSKQFVKSLAWYEQSFSKTFSNFYGDVSTYCILGLLPSYLEKGNSSLVYMVDDLIKKSRHISSGFYLYNHEALALKLQQNEKDQQPTLLIGVSYALLDFAEAHPCQLQHTIVMETGGMKGRREEMTKAALHKQLMLQLGTNAIHSEYGMTELMSQAYAKQLGLFQTPEWMKVILRSEDNPLETLDMDFNKQSSYRGAINIIDLANIDTCSFIATEDWGTCYANGDFEILGRLENSDIRGCGLMIL